MHTFRWMRVRFVISVMIAFLFPLLLEYFVLSRIGYNIYVYEIISCHRFFLMACIRKTEREKRKILCDDDHDILIAGWCWGCWNGAVWLLSHGPVVKKMWYEMMMMVYVCRSVWKNQYILVFRLGTRVKWKRGLKLAWKSTVEMQTNVIFFSVKTFILISLPFLRRGYECRRHRLGDVVSHIHISDNKRVLFRISKGVGIRKKCYSVLNFFSGRYILRFSRIDMVLAWASNNFLRYSKTFLLVDEESYA